MKKRCRILPYLLGLLLSIGLSACSYQTVQSEKVPPEREAREQKNILSENKESKKQSSDAMSRETVNKATGQELYSIENPQKKPSELGKASISEQITEKSESESGMVAAESEHYLTRKPEQTEQERTAQGQSAYLKELEKEQEKELKENKAQHKNQADANAELPDASSSALHILPEELDDGSEGELVNPASEALISDQEKSGNSNINRKGRDTYLMEEGKPKRFWNLQRQF